MRGTFVTRTYDSRRAFEERRESGVHVCHNSFTDIGLRWMWDSMAGNLRQADGTLNDHLGSARLVVGDSPQDFSPADTRLLGAQTAQAALDAGYPSIGVDLGVGQITFRATFGEQDGNFDWQERGVVSAQGVLIDRAVADGGRKVLGAVWTLEAILELAR